MRSQLYVANAAGKFRAELRGRGFRVVPAAAPSTTAEYLATRRPGRYPLVVVPDGDRERLHVGNADSRFIAGGFRLLDVEGAESGDCYVVEALEDGESVQPAGARQRVAYRVQAATAVPTVAPAAAGDGIAVRPQTTTLTIYASGVLGLARLWVRSVGGTWVDTLEDLDFTAAAVITRYVDLPGDRVYLRAAGAGLNVEIDATAEVG